MGYYARGSGSVSFSRALSDEEIDGAMCVIGAVFDDYDTFGNDDEETGLGISFWMDCKYYQDDLEKMLDMLVRDYPVSEGEVDFIGEDDAIWRYVYVAKENAFVEQVGRIVYE